MYIHIFAIEELMMGMPSLTKQYHGTGEHVEALRGECDGMVIAENLKNKTSVVETESENPLKWHYWILKYLCRRPGAILWMRFWIILLSESWTLTLRQVKIVCGAGVFTVVRALTSLASMFDRSWTSDSLHVHHIGWFMPGSFKMRILK